MKSFKTNPITEEELMIWKRNNLVNPRTNRNIKEGTSLHRFIKKQYEVKFLAWVLFHDFPLKYSQIFFHQGFAL